MHKMLLTLALFSLNAFAWPKEVIQSNGALYTIVQYKGETRIAELDNGNYVDNEGKPFSVINNSLIETADKPSGLYKHALVLGINLSIIVVALFFIDRYDYESKRPRKKTKRKKR